MAKLFKYVSILFCLGFCQKATAQHAYDKISIDSLYNLSYAYLDMSPDTTQMLCDIGIKRLGNKKSGQWAKFISMKAFAYEHVGMYRQSLKHLFMCLAYFKSVKDEVSTSQVHNSLGVVYDYMGNLDSARYYYQLGYDLRKKIKDESGLSASAGNLGLLYLNQGQFKKALDYLFESKKLAERLKDQPALSSVYTNIGLAYDKQGNHNKALEYYLRSSKIDSTMGDQLNLALSLNNIGAVYFEKKDYYKALDYHKKSLHIKEKANNRAGMVLSYHNLALVYESIDSNEQAFSYYKQAIDLARELEDDGGLMAAYIDLGNLYNKKQKYSEAIKLLEKALELENAKHLYGNVENAYRFLAKAYAGKGNYTKAYLFYQKYSTLHDSLNTYGNSKKLTELELESEYEKKKQEQAFKDQKRELQRKAEAERQTAKARQNFIIEIALACGILALIVIVIIVFRGYRSKQAANQNLQRQNEVITSQNSEIELQKHEIEAKNKDITDSIHYALRLQTAMLPTQPFLEKYLEEFFILYKPKDIVSGDFYWAHECGNESFLFAVVDCTGHGVPGSMVSIIGNNALNRAVPAFQLLHPADILNKINELVEEYFSKHSADEIRDGMDISLCLYNKKAKTLEFAGANNSLWIVRNMVVESESRSGKSETPGANGNLKSQTSNFELFELKADKQPIGRYEFRKPFSNHTVQLEEGDWIYLHTDGYGDQFGGPEMGKGGKKFKSSRLKQLLVDMGQQPAAYKQNELDKTLEKWAEGYEQNDDICVMGVKV